MPRKGTSYAERQKLKRAANTRPDEASDQSTDTRGRLRGRTRHGEVWSSNRWRVFAETFLKKNPLCVLCQREGITKASQEAHHVNKAQEHTEQAFVADNIRALCRDCHLRITALERSGRGDEARSIFLSPSTEKVLARIVVVYGPPGCGKTTYAKSVRKRGDIIVDVDAMFRALGAGAHDREGEEGLLPYVLCMRDALLLKLCKEGERFPGHVYLLTTTRTIAEYYLLRFGTRARIHQINISYDECLGRVSSDSERTHSSAVRTQQIQLVKDWYETDGYFA